MQPSQVITGQRQNPLHRGMKVCRSILSAEQFPLNFLARSADINSLLTKCCSKTVLSKTLETNVKLETGL